MESFGRMLEPELISVVNKGYISHDQNQVGSKVILEYKDRRPLPSVYPDIFENTSFLIRFYPVTENKAFRKHSPERIFLKTLVSCGRVDRQNGAFQIC